MLLERIGGRVGHAQGWANYFSELWGMTLNFLLPWSGDKPVTYTNGRNKSCGGKGTADIRFGHSLMYTWPQVDSRQIFLTQTGSFNTYPLTHFPFNLPTVFLCQVYVTHGWGSSLQCQFLHIHGLHTNGRWRRYTIGFYRTYWNWHAYKWGLIYNIKPLENWSQIWLISYMKSMHLRKPIAISSISFFSLST